MDLDWYYFNGTVANGPTTPTSYATVYQYLQSLTIGGYYTGAATSDGLSPATWSAPFHTPDGHTALWLWTDSEAGVNYTVHTPYFQYKDLAGGTTAVSNNQVIGLTTTPILLEQSIQTVTITSPTSSSNIDSAVVIAGSVDISSDHLEIWDSNNGGAGVKLGNVFAANFNAVYVLPNGNHVTTVNSVSSGGAVVASSQVAYSVSEFCTNSSTSQCDFDQLGIASPDTSCNDAPIEALWVGNPCAAQGTGSTEPTVYGAQENTTTALNSESVLFSETNLGYSNVIFSAYSPHQATGLDSHWTMDLYVYLPIVDAHQAIEFDLQYVWGGYWTKFYTECAFNVSSGTGYWAVYGGGNNWTFLNGSGAPLVPCDRSQFSTPWSGGPATTGWHHIVWTFTRNPGGYAEYNQLVFDGTTYTINYTPTTATNSGSNQGDFAALVQLDGAQDQISYPSVQAYVNELNISHTP